MWMGGGAIHVDVRGAASKTAFEVLRRRMSPCKELGQHGAFEGVRLRDPPRRQPQLGRFSRWYASYARYAMWCRGSKWTQMLPVRAAEPQSF